MANKDNTGVLFPNKRKETEKHPNLKGSALIEGNEYWLDAWVNTKKDTTEKYISLKFKLKEPGKSKTQKKLDDDIPF